MPSWVNEGYHEYIKRFPQEYQFDLLEIDVGKRGKKTDFTRLHNAEAEHMLAAIPQDSHVVALDINGKHWSTEGLAKQLGQWRLQGLVVSLLIGGPDGLAPSCLRRADSCWSLSPLTFPHQMVRVIVAEQLYRAHTILTGHLYHRG